MSNFLEALGRSINTQFGMAQQGSPNPGDYSSIEGFKFDRTAHRVYLESGVINNIRPNIREQIFQQPDATVLLKKKMFSSLIENSRNDILEQKERGLIRSAKRLFENKCKIISAYERLTKVEKFTLQSGTFNSYLLPLLTTSVDTFDAFGLNIISPNARFAIENLRKAIAFGQNSTFTTWLTDTSNILSGVGSGTGVIELTNFSNISTNTVLELDGGNASLTIEDPYKLMIVTEADIDRAISEVYGGSSFNLLLINQTETIINDLKIQLNNLRLSRGKSTISFEYEFDSTFGANVKSIIDFTGEEILFTYDAGLLGTANITEAFGGDSPVEIDERFKDGTQEISNDEESIFTDIIKNIFVKFAQFTTGRSQIFTWNDETSYIRNRLRMFFAKKSIINSMDVVYIYLSSKTQKDDGISLNQINQTIGSSIDRILSDITSTLGSTFSGGRIYPFGGATNGPDDIEKAAIVGSDFPTWLWRLFRNDFTKQGAGTCVFVGLVKNASRSYGNGAYRLSVSIGPISDYFSKSQINKNPSLDVFNGVLYDPLTPFDISFDAATGASITDLVEGEVPPLLPENERLLNSRSIKFRSGRFRGQSVSQVNYIERDGEVIFGNYRKILSDPAGFVYRWKQGIGTLTFTSRAANGSEIQNDRSPNLNKNPFAGQDAMNVISLLVTGQPYNFATFVKSALNNLNSLSLGDQDANSYIEGLAANISKTNATWGGFVPFKTLTMSDDSFQFIKTGQAELIGKNRRINELTKKKAELIDRLAVASANYETDETSDASFSNSIANERMDIRVELQGVSDDLDYAISEFQRTYDRNSAGIVGVFGDDITTTTGFDSSTSYNGESERERIVEREEFRRKVNKLTQRLIWKVRGNLDVNLFIVDDQYDKNFDILSFERGFRSDAMGLFNSDYTNVLEQLKTVSKILGLEVFPDTQGNIVARPPKYNMIPESVLRKLFKTRNDTGVRLFPEFLQSLFFNQIQGICNRIEIIEDEIRIRMIGLGYFAGSFDAQDSVIESIISSGQMSSAASAKFKFISDPNTGFISTKDFRIIRDVSSPDRNNEEQTLLALENLNGEVARNLQASKVFDAGIRSKLVSEYSIKIQDNGAIGGVSRESNYATIIKRLERSKGVINPAYIDMFASRDGKVLKAVFIDEILTEVSRFVAERQSLLRYLSEAIRNLRQGTELNSEGGSAALTPFLNLSRDADIPQILQHMIEFESDSDLGTNSGKRYIIRDENIEDISITEGAPNYTTVNVNGLFAEGFTQAPQQLSLQDGNLVTSAYAVNYDMWYQYGFIASQSIEAPFFSDPETQCAPYAVSMLNMASKNILKGTVSVVGYNEFYQPGDVVYIESEDLLFYVTAVAHSFSYGKLSTKLSLAYGHSPGEYIPTHLDVIGKIMYNSRGINTQIRSARFVDSVSETSLGAIIVNTQTGGLLDGPYGERNRGILNKALLSLSGIMSLLSVSGTKEPKIILRIFRDSNPPFNQTTMTGLKWWADDIKEWFAKPIQMSGDRAVEQNTPENMRISNDLIKIEDVNVGVSSKSPSSAAIAACREVIDNNGVRPLYTQNMTADNAEAARDGSLILDSVLFTNIIDILVVYEDRQIGSDGTTTTADEERIEDMTNALLDPRNDSENWLSEVDTTGEP